MLFHLYIGESETSRPALRIDYYIRFFFFFLETSTHTREREMSFNTKTHHKLVNKLKFCRLSPLNMTTLSFYSSCKYCLK